VPIVKKVFHDNKTVGGRPHTDERVIVRALLLRGWYGLSDPELEFQLMISFPSAIFLDFWKLSRISPQCGT